MNQEVKMHETMRVGILLAFVGGFLDVYTYLLRGGVFANAQTGNMVLLTLQISQGHFVQALYYLVPIVAFFMGAVVTEIVKKHDYWHEYVLVIEIILLFGVGLYPLSYPPIIVNSMVSFICAMQISSFKKLHGFAYATTVCTGNLRSAAENLTAYCLHHHQESKIKCLSYIIIIGSFCSGAIMGSTLISYLSIYAVWICSGVLSLVLVILIKDNLADFLMINNFLKSEKIESK